MKRVVLRLLPPVVGFDPVTRERKRVEGLAVAGALGRVDLRSADAQPDLAQIDAVEFPGELDQRPVAARGDVGDDGAYGVFDVLRRLALDVQEIAKARLEIGRPAVEAERHEASCRDRPAQGR